MRSPTRPASPFRTSARLASAAAQIAVLLAISACGDGATAPEPETDRISAVARAYLNSALDIMQQHSINRYKIEWTGFREDAFEAAGAAQTTADTYDAIRFALVQLGDHHSFFRAPSAPDPALSRSAALAPIIGHRLGSRLGYVQMPAFSSGTPEDMQEHAEQYHSILSAIDTVTLCGWVVDLRDNLGGNMWPMLAGIGPVLGEGIAGYFVDPDSVVQSWFYRDGAAGVSPTTIVQVTSPYELLKGEPTVAVLTNNRTASSGEAIVTAFRGRPDTRSFGTGTWGVSTANAGFALSDGAMILLTVATFADRTGHLYGGVIEPDETVAGAATGNPENDFVVARAQEWLLGQPACAGSS